VPQGLTELGATVYFHLVYWANIYL